jgi:hypothetical protein
MRGKIIYLLEVGWLGFHGVPTGSDVLLES